MTVFVSSRGDLEKLSRIGRHLRETGDKELKREAFRALNSATKEPKAEVKRRLPDYLPDDYAEVLNPVLRMQTTRGSKGVRVTARAKGRPRPRHVGRLDDGTLRHPLYANRNHWFNQRVKAGFFSEPMRDASPEMKEAIVAELDKLAAKIAHG